MKPETLFTFEKILQAYRACKKRKTNTSNYIEFQMNLEENLFILLRQLKNRTYKPQRSIAFVVKKPKVREIFAATFADRVVHHLLCGYLVPYYERIFIYDSWACRSDKGTVCAMKRLRGFLVKAEKEKMRYGLQEYYYLKLDIKSFFTSIDKQTLYELFLRRIKNKEVLWLLKVIIFHDPVRDIKPILQSSPALFDLLPQEKSLFKVKKGKGLPIGNLTSQFFANVYLNELDQYVKHTLKVKYYLRYVDDFILLDPSRERLEEMKVLIERFLLDKLQLKLHPKKQIIREVGTGIDFVGFIIRADYVLIRKRVLNDFKRAIEKAELMPAGTIQSKKIRQQLNSYFAHTMWGNCYTFSRRLLGESNWLASCHGEKIGIMSEEEMRRWSLILFEGAKDDYIMKEKPLLEGVVVKSSSSITFFLTNQEKCLNI